MLAGPWCVSLQPGCSLRGLEQYVPARFRCSLDMVGNITHSGFRTSFGKGHDGNKKKKKPYLVRAYYVPDTALNASCNYLI